MRRHRQIASIAAALALASCTAGSVPTTESAANTTTSADRSTTTTVPPTTTTTLVEPLLIRGKVIDSSRRPVADARVEGKAGVVLTSSDGLFEMLAFEGPDLVVTKPGWSTALLPVTETFTHVEISPLRIRALRLGADVAGSEAGFGDMLELADLTAVNAFVFDTKQEGGKVLYNTSVEAAHEAGAVDPLYDPQRRLAEARALGLYAITRIVVFEDSFRVAAVPDDKLAGGWVDPRSQDAWQYNIDLAVEACEIGFDEIQFDYVRFPSGRTAQVSGQLNLAQEERIAAIEGFLSAARAELIPLGCAVSADIFAIVVSVADDQGLGQRPEELSRQLDAISPMVYPSHYSEGWLGFPDPNDFPYEVTADAIEDALPRLEPGTALRPWLQAFWWSNAQIRSSIQAAEDRGVGWILWNARSNFDLEALPTDAEVSG